MPAKRAAPTKKITLRGRNGAAAEPVPTGTPHVPREPDLTRMAHARQLFWENTVREMLAGLSMIQMSGKHPELFDGRFAVLTRGGERIPIAEVWPMFACGLNTSDADKSASIAVECTVFRIQTPDGEVFTIPLSEVRSLHTLTPELMAALEKQAMERAARMAARGVGRRGSQEPRQPFGLAAFTSLSRPAGPAEPAPGHPTE